MPHGESGGYIPPEDDIDVTWPAKKGSVTNDETDVSDKVEKRTEAKKKSLTLNQMIGLGMAAVSVFTASVGYAMYGARSERVSLRDKEVNRESILKTKNVAEEARASYIQTLVDQDATEEEINQALEAPQFKEAMEQLTGSEVDNSDAEGCATNDKEVTELINNYPIIGTLPYYTDTYRIDMTYEGDSEVPIIDITLVTGGDTAKEADIKSAVEKWLNSEDSGYKKLELRYTTE